MAFDKMFYEIQSDTKTGFGITGTVGLLKLTKDAIGIGFGNTATGITDLYHNAIGILCNSKPDMAMIRSKFKGVGQQVEQSDFYLFIVTMYFYIIAGSGKCIFYFS